MLVMLSSLLCGHQHLHPSYKNSLLIQHIIGSLTLEDQMNMWSSLPEFLQIKKQTKILTTSYSNQRPNIFPISPTIFCK